MSRVVMLCIEGLNVGLINDWLDNLPTFQVLQKKALQGAVRMVPPKTFPNCWLKMLCGHNANPVHTWDFNYRDDFLYGPNRSFITDISERNTLYSDLPRMGQRIGVVNLPGIHGSYKIPGGYVVPSDKPETGENGACSIEAIEEFDTRCFSSLSELYQLKPTDFIAAFITGYATLLDSAYRLDAVKKHPEDRTHLETVRRYYQFLDGKIGHFLTQLDENTTLIILSMYGLIKLQGRVNINEILVDTGDLVLRKKPKSISDFRSLEIDWRKTRCWSTGFNGSIYLNLKGREAKGIVEAKDYEKTLDNLTRMMESLRTIKNEPMQIHTWRRNDLYYDLEASYGPDLFVDIEHFTTSELIGHTANTTQSYDLSPEGFNAVSDTSGICFLYGAGASAPQVLDDVNLDDIAPTVIELLDILIRGEMRGRSILSSPKKDTTEGKRMETAVFQSRLDTLAKDERTQDHAQENEAKIRSRLDALGY